MTRLLKYSHKLSPTPFNNLSDNITIEPHVFLKFSIIAGDFTRMGELNEVRRFNEELGELNFAHKIVVAGNHELSFDQMTQSRHFRLLFAIYFAVFFVFAFYNFSAVYLILSSIIIIDILSHKVVSNPQF